MIGKKLTAFFLPKIKFAATSTVATSVDYGVFFSFLYFSSSKYVVPAQLIAYCSGLLVNFVLQKKFIFKLNRRLISTFQLSVSFSLFGLFLSTLLIYLFNLIPFFQSHLIAAKVLITGILFFYNFYSKRYSFEGAKVHNT